MHVHKGGFSTFVNGKGFRQFQGVDACLEEINYHIDHLVERVEKLEKENEELKSEYYKDEVIQKLKKDNERLQNDYFRGFPITQEEKDKIYEWEEQHWANQHNAPDLESRLRKQGAIGGTFAYEFVPTSIGTYGAVYCQSCKNKAYMNCGNNTDRFRELMKEYDAEFVFQEL